MAGKTPGTRRPVKMKPLLNKRQLRQLAEDLGIEERFQSNQTSLLAIVASIREKIDPLVLIAMDAELGDWHSQLFDYTERCISPRITSLAARKLGLALGWNWNRHPIEQQLIGRKVVRRVIRHSVPRLTLPDRMRQAEEQLLLHVFSRVAPGYSLSVNCDGFKATDLHGTDTGQNRAVLHVNSWLDTVRKLGGPVAYYKDTLLLIVGAVLRKGDPRMGDVTLYDHRLPGRLLRLRKKVDRLYQGRGGKIGWIIRRSGWPQLARDRRGARKRFNGKIYSSDMKDCLDVSGECFVGPKNAPVDLNSSMSHASMLKGITITGNSGGKHISHTTGGRPASHLFATGEIGQFFY